MRQGFDRLAQLVKSKLGEDPQAGSLFVFANRNATRLKAMWFDHNGYCLLYKRLHRALFELPDVSRYLGAGFDPRAVARVLINPSVAYWETAWRQARRGRFSSRPVMSTQIPTVYDPSNSCYSS